LRGDRPPIKIQVEEIYKVFGKTPTKAIDLLKQGASKDEIQEKTGNVVGLNNVSFSVDAGEIFVVMGLSGSGKSTLIRCLNRLIPPTSGKIYIDSDEILAFNEERLRDLRRHKVSMVFQRFALFPHKTVTDNVAYGLKVRGMKKEDRHQLAQQTLDLVGLSAWGNYYPRNLSGGMQQRVGLGRALATDPDILLMDEPFGALDPLIRREIQEELLQLQRAVNKTIVFITHDLHEALKLGDRIAIMKDGHFVQVGTPEQIVSQPADEYVTAFTQDVDLGRVITVRFITQATTPLLLAQDDLAQARQRFASENGTALYVVDDTGLPVGLLRQEAALAEPSASLAQAMDTSFPVAEADRELADVYRLCTQGLPVAVVDENGRFQGTLHYQDVLSTLSTNNTAAI
jgi:glycine betaine/proline transport system ATP-binding protein